MKNFEKINCLLVSKRFDQYLRFNTFEFLKETSPPYLHDVYTQSGQNQANTRSYLLKLKLYLRKTCSGLKSLLYLTPIVWNSLPTDVKLAIHLIISNISWKMIFSRNLQTWNKIFLLVDTVLGTWTVVFSIIYKLIVVLFKML